MDIHNSIMEAPHKRVSQMRALLVACCELAGD